MNLDLLREELMRDEGSRKDSEGRHIAYKDSLGFWTIGYGHLMGGKPTLVSCTEDTARALLDQDIDAATTLARNLVQRFDTLTDERQRALVNMAFNRGNHLKTSSKILPAIIHASLTASESDWHKVPDAIAGSQWAAQVGARATRLAAMFAGDASVGAGADPEAT